MVVPIMLAMCSGQFRAAQESVVEVEAGLEQLVASHPSVAAASHRGILEVVLCLAVVVALVLVDLAAMAVCPSQGGESV